MKSFLIWAGGKSRIISRLVRYAPADYHKRAYYEPFVGSGAMYFSLGPQKAVLGDLNSDLIDCYRAVRDNPRHISNMLSHYSKSHSADFYMACREAFNSSRDRLNKAALFIYLNKASFNAIYRVNKAGEFNVPFGHKKRIILPTYSQLSIVSQLLKTAAIVHGNYAETARRAKEGDFVYLDPPYPPLNGTAYFTHYTKERFGLDDQKGVSELARTLHERGCLVMISNTDLPLIRSLYQGWNIHMLPVNRWLTCKTKKYRITDLVITNYSVKGQ